MENPSHAQSSTTMNSPKPRSEISPYPTTFVQADTSSFKQVVQMLTGSADTAKNAAVSKNPIPPIRAGPRKPQSGFKLYERRNSLLKGLNISPPFINRKAPPEFLSPSMLDFPALALSPVTPLMPDPFKRASPRKWDLSLEEKGIAEKGFYLHPSPGTTPRESEPHLLPLFPVTSPKSSFSC